MLGEFRWCWGCGLKVLVRCFSFYSFKRASRSKTAMEAPSLPARAFAQGSSQRIVFLCVYVSAVLPARALSFSIRTFVFPARALVVFFMIAVRPARALASGTQNSILPARALTNFVRCFLRLLLYRRGRSCQGLDLRFYKCRAH